MNSIKPDVSVWMTTYFHESTVRQAIESVLAQVTSFTYELIIADDCSQDTTVQILEEYQKAYPDRIRLILNQENLGIPQNTYNARCACRGKYLVSIAGDDYWIDKNKLQLQYDFFQLHPEYLAICTVIEARYDDDTEPFCVYPAKEEWNSEYTIEKFAAGKLLYQHGMMVRNPFLEESSRAEYRHARTISQYIDDQVEMVLLLKYGKVFVLGSPTYAYRINRDKTNKLNYNSKYTVLEKSKHIIDLNNGLFDFLNGEVDLYKRYLAILPTAILYGTFKGKMGQVRSMYDSIPKVYRDRGLWRESSRRTILTGLRYLKRLLIKQIRRKK